MLAQGLLSYLESESSIGFQERIEVVEMKIKGKCLCGKVEFAISNDQKTFDACHCSMCRRWSGSPSLAVEANGGGEFRNQDYIKVYSSSDWAERGFCSNCGSHLFYRLKNGSYWNVPLGLLDGHADFTFKTQIFVDHKPKCYSFADETKMMTEAEVLKAFGGQ